MTLSAVQMLTVFLIPILFACVHLLAVLPVVMKLLMLFGLGFEEAYGVVIASLSNIGPAIGECGPAYSWNALPDIVKWFSTALMLIGRLELFTILLLFTPGFWKKH